MPCLNEAATVADCVTQAREALTRYGVNGEVIVDAEYYKVRALKGAPGMST